MRLTIAWTLSIYIYFLIIMINIVPLFMHGESKFIILESTLVGSLFLLLLCSVINKVLVKKFFPYPKGDFVRELKNDFMKERLSERIYIGIRNGFIPAIVLLSIGTIVKTAKGSIFTFIDVIILGAPVLLILVFRLIFTLYQKISDKKNNASNPY